MFFASTYSTHLVFGSSVVLALGICIIGLHMLARISKLLSGILQTIFFVGFIAMGLPLSQFIYILRQATPPSWRKAVLEKMISDGDFNGAIAYRTYWIRDTDIPTLFTLWIAQAIIAVIIVNALWLPNRKPVFN